MLAGWSHLRQVAYGTEDEEGQPTFHLRRVVQGGSATTLGQPRARGRSVNLLSMLTPSSGRGGATMRAEVVNRW